LLEALCRRQFQRCGLTLRILEALHVLCIGLGGVFRRERLIGSVVEPRTADSNRANGKLMVGNLDVSQRLRKESAIPAVGLIVPGADHHAARDNNYPDAYKPMVACADGQVFCGFKPGKDTRRKKFCRRIPSFAYYRKKRRDND